jgi:hypothetical protein
VKPSEGCSSVVRDARHRPEANFVAGASVQNGMTKCSAVLQARPIEAYSPALLALIAGLAVGVPSATADTRCALAQGTTVRENAAARVFRRTIHPARLGYPGTVGYFGCLRRSNRVRLLAASHEEQEVGRVRLADRVAAVEVAFAPEAPGEGVSGMIKVVNLRTGKVRRTAGDCDGVPSWVLLSSGALAWVCWNHSHGYSVRISDRRGDRTVDEDDGSGKIEPHSLTARGNVVTWRHGHITRQATAS